MRRASGWNISDAPSRAKRGAFSTFEFAAASRLYDSVLRRLVGDDFRQEPRGMSRAPARAMPFVVRWCGAAA
jgi:hypothetical protein